ncbi:MAG: hypothetical protein J5801_01175 [Bacteroidales bacterium]|nr:hypothetical protein [Bacteroidales bacterium]
MKNSASILFVFALFSLFLNACTPEKKAEVTVYDPSIEGFTFYFEENHLYGLMDEPYTPKYLILGNGFDRNGESQVWCKTRQATNKDGFRFYVNEKNRWPSSNPYIDAGSVAINGDQLEFRHLSRNFTNCLKGVWKIVPLGNNRYRLESIEYSDYYCIVEYTGYNTPGDPQTIEL